MFPIVKKLGGWSAAQDVLERRGVEFNNNTKNKWSSRGQLPRNVVAALGAEASARGIIFVESDFSLPDDEERAA